MFLVQICSDDKIKWFPIRLSIKHFAETIVKANIQATILDVVVDWLSPRLSLGTTANDQM